MSLSRRAFRPLLPLTFVALALTAAGCGRRGPMELPEVSSLGPSPVGTPEEPAQAPRVGLARDIRINDAANRDRVLAPALPIIVPKTPFILDPLL